MIHLPPPVRSSFSVSGIGRFVVSSKGQQKCCPLLFVFSAGAEYDLRVMRREHYPLEKFKKTLLDFEGALARLGDILRVKKDGLVCDAALRCFDIAFMLSSKLIRIWLGRGDMSFSPMQSLTEANKRGLISDRAALARIVRLRRDSLHAYDLKRAERAYGALPEALIAFEKLSEALKKEQ